MKRLLSLAVFLILASPAWGAFKLISSVCARSTDTTNVVTVGIDTTGADLIILHAATSTALLATVSDSKSNTWTALPAAGDSLDRSRLYYFAAGTVGTGHTFTGVGTGTYPAICVAAFSGAASSPLDQQNGAHNNGNVSSIQTGSVTPSEANELIFTGLTFDADNVGVSIGSGFTSIASVNYTAGQSLGNAIAYLIQGAAAAVNPTWSMPNNPTPVATRIATFRTASPPPPATVGHRQVVKP